MNRVKYVCLFNSVSMVLGFVFCSACSWGQTKLPTTLSIQVDQDKFTPGNEDRNYTMGVYIDYDSPLLDNSGVHNLLRIPAVFFCEKMFPSFDEPVFGNNQIGIYGGGFTPDSLGTQSIVKGDRPYSSLIGMTLGINYHFSRTVSKSICGKEQIKKYRNTNLGKRDFRYRYFNVMAGGLGFSMQGQLQTFIHSFTPTYEDTIAYINPVKPYGWGNQISNGGGLTGLVQFGGSRLLTTQFLTRFISAPITKNGWIAGEQSKLNWMARHFEMKAGYQLMVGYYNSVQLNAEFRFGAIDPTRWSGTWTSNGSGNNLAAQQFLPGEKELPNKRDFELFVFGGIRGNFMIYNALLRGQFIEVFEFGNSSKYVLGANEVNPFFLSGNIGLALRFRGITASFSPVSFRTSELNTESKYIRTHKWGEIKLKLSFR